MQYGKLEHGNIRYAPNKVVYNGNKVYNPTDEILISLGYLPVVLGVDLPYKEGFYIETTYEMANEEITIEDQLFSQYIKRVQNYVEQPFQEPQPTIEEQILELQNALISQKISGGGITITDSLSFPVEEFVMSGKTEQVTTKGLNLIPFPYTDKDMIKNGVTFKVQPDGGVRIYGTAAETATFFLSAIDYGNNNIFNNGTDNGKILSGGKDGVVIEYNGTNKKTYLTISKDKTVNTVIYPQLQNGSTATPYEPYTGGKPSPSPDYPQKIETTPQGIITVNFTDGTNHQTVELYCPREFTKWDKLQKIDGVWKWVFQTDVITITGEEKWEMYNKIFYTTSYDLKRLDEAFCEFYKYTNEVNGLNFENLTFSIGAGIYENSIFFRNDLFLVPLKNDDYDITNSKKKFISYLKEMNTKGIPIKIMLKKEKPEYVSLFPSEQEKLNALTMYAPNTEVTNTGDCNMELTYTVDTKSYIDNKIAELNAQIVNTQTQLIQERI